jgi:hypothetical protein
MGNKDDNYNRCQPAVFATPGIGVKKECAIRTDTTYKVQYLCMRNVSVIAPFTIDPRLTKGTAQITLIGSGCTKWRSVMLVERAEARRSKELTMFDYEKLHDEY